MDPFAANSFVWPLSLVAVALLVAWRLESDVAPITRGILAGLSEHARSHFLVYALAFLLATNAGIDAFTDTFGKLTRTEVSALAWWQVLALCGKCLQGPVAALIALLVKSPLNKEPKQ